MNQLFEKIWIMISKTESVWFMIIQSSFLAWINQFIWQDLNKIWLTEMIFEKQISLIHEEIIQITFCQWIRWVLG